MDETRTLVEACLKIGHRRLPDNVREYAKTLLLDYLGVAAAGASLEESSRIVREVAQAMGGNPEATGFGLSEKLPAAQAALVNAVAAHGVEMDDTHSPASSHPGVVLWSVGLAVAEREREGGDALLQAVAAGYEMACRAGYAASPPSLYQRGFHPTSVSGVFGAAVAASCLLNLDLGKTMMAVGIAGSFASGNMEYLEGGTLTKRIQPGQAAHAGVLSALLAQRGYTGPRTILEGSSGYLHAYSDRGKPELLVENLGESWEITATGIKAFGCCRYIHSPIEATLRAVKGHPLKPDMVAEINVGLVDAGWSLVVDPIEQKYRPKTRVDAQFSLPFAIATALVNGRATVHEFREAQLSDPTILSLAEKVQVHHDDGLDRAYPARWPSWSEVRLSDGKTLRSEVNTTKGDPENPLSEAEIRTKFEALATPYWSQEESHLVASRVQKVEHSESIDPLMALVRR